MLSAQTIAIDEGLIDHRFQMPGSDTADHNFMWFIYDAIITERKVDIRHNFDSVEYVGHDVFAYTYYDLPTRTIYEYNDFSDTAKPVMRYQFEQDAFILGLLEGGPENVIEDSLVVMADTLIHNKLLHRVRHKVDFPEEEFTNITFYYFSCNGYKLKNIHFQKRVEHYFPDCFMGRIDYISVDKQGIMSGGPRNEIVRPSLTSFEKTVFECWKSNAIKSTLPFTDPSELYKINPNIPIKLRSHPTYRAMYPNLPVLNNGDKLYVP